MVHCKNFDFDSVRIITGFAFIPYIDSASCFITGITSSYFSHSTSVASCLNQNCPTFNFDFDFENSANSETTNTIVDLLIISMAAAAVIIAEVMFASNTHA